MKIVRKRIVKMKYYLNRFGNCLNYICQDPIRSGEIEESSISRKRYSLPMIYKKEMTRHHHDLTSIPPLPLINENYK